MVREINLGPLSMRICFGKPRQEAIMSKTRIVRKAGREKSISNHRISRLKSSMMFKVRSAEQYRTEKRLIPGTLGELAHHD